MDGLGSFRAAGAGSVVPTVPEPLGNFLGKAEVRSSHKKLKGQLYEACMFSVGDRELFL